MRWWFCKKRPEPEEDWATTFTKWTLDHLGSCHRLMAGTRFTRAQRDEVIADAHKLIEELEKGE